MKQGCLIVVALAVLLGTGAWFVGKQREKSAREKIERDFRMEITTALANEVEPPEAIEEKSDRFTNKRWLDLKDGSTWMPETKFYANVTLKDEPSSSDLSEIYWIRTSTKGWHWLKDHDVKVLLDSEPWPVLAKFRSEYENGIAQEIVSIYLPMTKMAKLCAAQKVEVRIGDDENELNAQQMAALRALLKSWVERTGFSSK